LLLIGAPVEAATLTWDAGNTTNGSTIDPGNGTWDLSSSVWNNGTVDVPWTQTSATAPLNSSVFAGADGTYAVNLGADVATSLLTFNASGYTFSAATPHTITGIPQFIVAAGKTVTVGSNVTVTGNSGSFFLDQPNVSNNVGGTLIIENGGLVQGTAATVSLSGKSSTVTVNSGGTLRATLNTTGGMINISQPASTGGSATLNVNGGTVTTAAGNMVVANANTGGSATGTLNVTGGTVTLGGAAALVIAGGSSAATTTATGTVNQSGGTITTGTGGVSMGLLSAGTNAIAVYNLDGGTLVTPKIFKNVGSATLNFNGGTIRPTASNATFLQGLDAANVKAGGAVFDTNGFNITVAQPLLAAGGGLTKQGAGTLTLTGANTYTGATAVNAGTLQVDGSLAAGSTVNVAGNATLTGIGLISGTVVASSASHINPGTTTSTGTLNVGGLTLNSGAVLDYELGGSSDQINVTSAGGLTINGAGINLFATGGLLPFTSTGTFTLIDYNGTFSGSLSNLTIANARAGKTYTLQNDTVNTAITMTVADLTSEWNNNAGTGLWTTSGNWTAAIPNSVNANALFGQLTGGGTVQVNGPKTVGALTFDNSSGYMISGGAGDLITLSTGTVVPAGLNVISGNHTIAAPLALSNDLLATIAPGSTLGVSGNISGATKNVSVVGGGTLMLTGANTYAATSVGNTVSGGTLQIGDGGTSGNIGSGDVTIAAASNLAFNRSDTVTVANNIGGAAGTVTQMGSGTLVLSGNNTFGTTAGGLVVIAGTVKAGSATGLNGSIATVNNGVLDLNGFNVTLGGLAGTPGGTVTDNSVGAGTTTLTVNQAGNLNFSGAIANSASKTVALTKTGAGNLTLDDTAANTFTGLTTVTGGTLTLSKSGVPAILGNVQIGDGVGSDILQLGAQDQIADTSVLSFTAGPSGSSAFFRINGFNETIKGITTTVANAAVIENNGPSGTATLTVDTSGSDFTYDGIFRDRSVAGNLGIFALTKSGAGTLTVANTARVAATSYTGATTITGGKLIIDNLDAFSSVITNNSAAADALTFNQTTKNLSLTTLVPISGTGALTKTGAGTLTLAAFNSYTGATKVAGGTLIINGGLDPASTVTVASGATLGGVGSVNGNVIVSGGAHIGGATATTPGTINVGGLTLNSGALLDFEFGNSSDLINVMNPGSLTLSGGAINLFATGGAAPLTNGTYTLIDYNTNYLGQLANLTVNNPIIGKLYTFHDDTANTLITVTVGDDASEWKGLAGDGKWTTAGNWTAAIPNGAGVKALFGQIPSSPTAIAVSGPKIVSAIIFDNSNSYTINGGPSDIITMDTGKTTAAEIDLYNGNHTLAAPIALNSDLAVTVAQGYTLALNSNISGATKNLSANGAGIVALGGTNSYATTTVNNGTLQVGDGATAGTLGTGAVTVGAAGILSFNRSDTVTIGNAIGGASGTVSQDGSGVTILAGANTFGTTAGGLVVNAGTLRVGSNTAIAAIGRITVNGGTLDLNGLDVTVASLAGTGGTITDNSTGSAGTTTLIVSLPNTTDASTYSGSFANGPTRTVGLRKLGLGTLTLDGSALNTHTGLTSVLDGTLILAKSGVNAIVGNVLIGDMVGSDVLQLGAADQIADSSVITFNSGPGGGSAFFRLNGFDETIKGITTTVANAAVIENNGPSGTATLTVDTSGSDFTYDGIFRDRSVAGNLGIFALTKAGAGTLTIANTVKVVATTYTGATTITGGKLVIDNLDAFSSPITNNSPTTDALTFNQTAKNLTIGAGVVISGTGGLTKTGALGLTTIATHTYTGPTTVAGGRLTVTGSIASSSGVTVTDPSGVFEAASTQTVKALTVTAGIARIVSATKIALTVGDGTQASSQLSLTGGTLDLTTNGVAIHYAAGNDAAVLTSTRAQIIAGYNLTTPTSGDGNWKGTTGITSANAAASSLGAVGYSLAIDALAFANGATTDTFLGTTVEKNTVLARYTLSGDVNLDGAVDFLDLAKLAQSYNVTDGTRQWSTGDFNYDGNTDFLDLAKLAQNYNTALPSAPIPGAPANFQADLARAFASVPEPSLIGVLGLCMLARLSRRRKPR
jgi:autotransporter-associated beta strand protein